MRFKDTFDQDDQSRPHGDTGWIGVNMRLESDQVQPGFMSEAVNTRFRSGIAETRLGLALMPWMNKIVDGKVRPWGKVYGVGVFSDPITFLEYGIIAADGKVYYCRSNNAPVEIPLPAATTINVPVNFTQCFDVLLMFRGFELPELRMANVKEGFQSITQTPTGMGDGTEQIPNSIQGIFFQNRLFLPNTRDEVAASDIGDYTRYRPIFQEFRVNQGSADVLRAIYKFNDVTLVAFKDHSVYVINNVYGNLEALQQDDLTTQFGLIAAKSIAHVGNDLWFLSELGVMTITQTESNKLQGVVHPSSEPIQPLIDRINWRYAAAAVAAYHDSRYYLAVPLDDAEIMGPELATGILNGGSSEVLIANLEIGGTYRWEKGEDDGNLVNGDDTITQSGDFVAQTAEVVVAVDGSFLTGSLQRVYKGVNNAVLVYDFLNGAWSGYDNGPDFAVQQFFIFTHNNRRRLFAVTPQGYVFLYDETFTDQLAVPYVDVLVVAQPEAGDTITVNDGDEITADRGTSDNFATLWGVAGISSDAWIANLWGNPLGGSGFGPGTHPRWAAPDTLTFPILGGIRFYGTNGVIPTVEITGSWASVIYRGTREIETTLATRGYDGRTLSYFRWLTVFLQTWRPNYTLTLLTEGVNEVTTLAENVTKDRTRYYTPFNKPRFDPTNVNDDSAAPKREDYSVQLGEPGPTEVFVGSGLKIDQHQEAAENHQLNTAGRAARVRIVNRQGRVRVMGVLLENQEQPQIAGPRR